MAEGQAEQRHFAELLCGLCLWFLCVMAGVSFLLAKAREGKGEGQGAARTSGPSQTPTTGSSESHPSGPCQKISAGAVVRQQLRVRRGAATRAGHSKLRDVVLLNALLARLRRSWRCPLEMSRYCSRHISRHKGMKEAMKAALFRQRRKETGRKVGCDSMD